MCKHALCPQLTDKLGFCCRFDILGLSELLMPRPHILMERWAEKYGPVFRCVSHAHALCQPVILNPNQRGNQ